MASNNINDDNSEQKRTTKKAIYSKPILEKFGLISVVTQKSGPTPDAQQTSKPGGGTG